MGIVEAFLLVTHDCFPLMVVWTTEKLSNMRCDCSEQRPFSTLNVERILFLEEPTEHDQ